MHGNVQYHSFCIMTYLLEFTCHNNHPFGKTFRLTLSCKEKTSVSLKCNLNMGSSVLLGEFVHDWPFGGTRTREQS